MNFKKKLLILLIIFVLFLSFNFVSASNIDDSTLIDISDYDSQINDNLVYNDNSNLRSLAIASSDFDNVLNMKYSNDISTSNLNNNSKINSNQLVGSYNNDNCIFVNVSFSGEEKGTLENPFKTFDKAFVDFNNSAKSIIFLSKGSYTVNQTFSFTKNITIAGESRDDVVFNCNGFKSPFLFYNSTVILENLTILNASTESKSGIIYGSNSNLRLYNIRTLNNTLNARGSVIKVQNGNFSLDSSVINNIYLNSYSNQAEAEGSIIFGNNSNINVNNSSISEINITSYGYSGGFIKSNQNITIINSSISNVNINTGITPVYGGIILAKEDFYLINSSIYRVNVTSMNIQGGLITYAPNFKYYDFCINNSNISNNYFKWAYGIIYNDGSMGLNISNSKFINNTIDFLYGNSLIYNLKGISNLNNTELTNNNIKDYSKIPENKQFMWYLNNAFEDYELVNIPDKYDLRDYGYVTSVKNQGSSNSCWTFAAMAVLESYLLKEYGITYDLSENNLKNIMSKYGINGTKLDQSYGGDDAMALAYLLRWSGAVNESDDPFNATSTTSPALNPIIHVQGALYLPVRKNLLDNNQIKKAIMEYGAVYTNICWLSQYQQYLTNAYYCNGIYSTNHAITIVGWDDNYSASNFIIRPPGDGAFIIKNSWGPYSGDNGYYYVSYYDTTIGGSSTNGMYAGFVFTNVESVDNYDSIYQHDIYGNNYWSFGNYNETAYFANQFTSNANESLSAFGFYTYGSSNYTVSVYVNNQLVHSQDGNIKGAGYNTVKFNKSIKLTKGDIFKISICLTTPNCLRPIAIECPDYYEYPATSEIDQSFFSFDGKTWHDLTNNTSGKSLINSSVCLKAYTTYKKTTEIKIKELDNFTYGENKEIIVYLNSENKTLTEDASITLYINGSLFATAKIINDSASFNYNCSKAGTYFIRAVYDGSDLYESSEISSTLKVNKMNTSIVSENISVYYGDNISINITLYDINHNNLNLTNVIVKYNNSSKNLTVINGKVNISDILDCGNYSCDILFESSDNYESSNTSINILINKRPINLSNTLSNIKAHLGDKISFELIIKDNLNNTLNLTKNYLKIYDNSNKSIDYEINSNIISFKILNTIDVGNITVSLDDSNYEPLNTSFNLDLIKHSTKFDKIEDIVLIDNKTLSINIKFYEDDNLIDIAGKDLTLVCPDFSELISTVTNNDNSKTNDKSNDKTDDKGNGNINNIKFDLSNHLNGIYKLVFIANATHNESFVLFNVSLKNSVNSSFLNSSYNSNIQSFINISVNLTSNNNTINEGFVNFYINNTYIGGSSLNNGLASINYNCSNTGNYVIKANYTGSDNFTSCEVESNLIISNLVTQLKSSNVSIKLGENATIPVNLYVEEKPVSINTIKVSYLNKSIICSVVDNKFNLPVNDLKSGNYTINLVFEANENYTQSTTSINLEIIKVKHDSYIILNNYTVAVDNLINISIDIKSNIGNINEGNVKFYLNGSVYDVNIKNGKAFIEFNASEVNNYTIICEYLGNEDYNPSLNNSILTVNKCIVNMTGSYINSFYKENYIIIKLDKEINAQQLNISFSNGKNITLKTNKSGIAKYYIPFAPGNYSLNISAINQKYDILNYSLNNIIIKKGSAIIVPTKLTTTYDSGKYFNIKVINSKTKKPLVCVKLNLKIYTGSKYINVKVTTGANGIARYSASKLSLTKHKVIITSLEPTKYLSSKANSSYITVKKAISKAYTPKVTNKYKSNSYFNITVRRSDNNKVIKGISINCKVYTNSKYKTYNLKTDSKGIAKLSTKTLSKGTHKVLISSNNMNYSLSKTSSVVIK